MDPYNLLRCLAHNELGPAKYLILGAKTVDMRIIDEMDDFDDLRQDLKDIQDKLEALMGSMDEYMFPPKLCLVCKHDHYKQQRLEYNICGSALLEFDNNGDLMYCKCKKLVTNNIEYVECMYDRSVSNNG